MKPLILVVLTLCVVISDVASAIGTTPRAHVLIVGSSTAYPIIATVAERFGRDPDHATPVVESTGTGGGFKLFCAGSGLSTPDLVMASRPMKDSERRQCADNDVVDVREIKIGYDGVVLVNRRGAPAFSLSNRDIWLAVAQQVPSTADAGELVANPYRRWHDLNPELPDVPIRILGPPPTSGTRDILLERLLRKACDIVPVLRELATTDPQAFAQRCYTLREDGAFVNAGENDGRLVRKLLNDPDAVGILGFNFLDRNRDRLQAATIDGIEPRFELIESGIYPLSRPLYVYAKPRHARIVPQLDAFIDELVAAHASGQEGYLVDHGLIPLR